MKKLNIPRRGYHAFLFFLLSMFIPAFSFSQTITGLLSDENNKPPVGANCIHKGNMAKCYYGNDSGFVSMPKARTN